MGHGTLTRTQATPSTSPLDELDRLTNQDDPIRLMTLQELAAKRESVRFLVEGIVAAGHVGVIAGPEKSFKTSTMIDLLTSGAGAVPFFGRFAVPKPFRSVFIGGESGEDALARDFERIARSKGLDFSGIDDIRFSPDLSSLDDDRTLTQLRKIAEATDLIVLDPLCYMIDPGDQAGNVFVMSKYFKSLSRIAQDTGAAITVAHHFTSSAGKRRGRPTLADMSYAGAKQCARYWLLTKLRGEHKGNVWKYWLVTGGGSAYSRGVHTVRVDQGPDGDRWDVKVFDEDESEAVLRTQAEPKPEKPKAVTRDVDGMILDYLRRVGEASENAISKEAFKPVRKHKTTVKASLERLHSAKKVKPISGKIRNREVILWVPL
jgi:hypothetical protein